MWQVQYFRAVELAREREREAARERQAHLAHVDLAPTSRFDGLRRGGALIAAGIARRLDECAAREQLGITESV